MLMKPQYQELAALLHFRSPPPPPSPPIAIDDSSWKNAAETFTVAPTLTLGGYESAIAPNCLGTATWNLIKPELLNT